MAETIREILGEDLFGRIQRAAFSDAEIEAHERAAQIENRRALLEHAGVARVLTEDALQAVIEDRCEPTQALRSLHWLTRTRVLGLFGPPDAGKTVAGAYALARTPGRYHELGKLAEHRRAKRGKAERVWRAALDAQLLVLDELGAEDDAEEAAAALHELINLRLRGRWTILLANLDRPTWEARYDARTLSRLDEVGKLLRVDATGLRKRVGEAST